MKNFRENLMHAVFFVCALTSIAAVVLICVFLFANGVPAMREIGLLDFLTGAKWKPGNDIYGILPMILGSIYITAGAVVIGVPIGLLTAIFMAYYCPKKLYGLLKPCTELLAGIPSIVYGFFGMVIIVPCIRTVAALFDVDISGSSILAASILVKLWMMFFNRNIGRRIDSTTLEATASDSRNDVITTGAVLLCTILAKKTGLDLDGYVGAAVAVFILISGFSLVRDTLDPLLGKAPSPETVRHIRDKIMAYPGVLGVHDLMIHDYGPGRQFASVHVEMSAPEDPIVSHDIIDAIERDFLKDEKLHLVVHYDPIATDDPRIPALREAVSTICRGIDPKMTIHDLRIVPGKTRVNVVFDCIVPFDVKLGEKEIQRRIASAMEKEYPGYCCVATLEHSYTE